MQPLPLAAFVKMLKLRITTMPELFVKSQTLETGLSDFHKLTLTVLKNTLPERKASNCKIKGP